MVGVDSGSPVVSSSSGIDRHCAMASMGDSRRVGEVLGSLMKEER
jgi:hypothetical protein